MRSVCLLGASGSIGTQSLDVMFKNKEFFNLVSFSVGNNTKNISRIINKFPEVKNVYLVDNKKKKYRYLGPVYRYYKLVIEKYSVTTLAVSEAQAVNNILYRVKHYLCYPANCGGIKLKGPIFIEED